MDNIAERFFKDDDMTVATGTLTSDPVDLNDMIHIGIHAVWTGTPAGDLYFEVSGQIGEPTVWEVFDSVSVAGSGSQYWIDRNIPYKWARLRYVPTGGTGTINADAIAKGER